MMAGPQIMSAIVFVTHDRAIRVSLVFLAGVLLATTIGTVACAGSRAWSMALPAAVMGAPQARSYRWAWWLVAALLKNFVNRDTIEPPKWLGSLLAASTGKAFVVGLALTSLVPSDLVIMLTVGANLETHDQRLTAAIPFILATLLVAASPFLVYLFFRRRAVTVMPKVRDWMNTSSWLGNIIVYLIFILLIIA